VTPFDSAPDPDDPDGIADGRGGTAALPKLSKAAWAGIGVGIAVMALIAGYVGWRMSQAPVRWQEVGFVADSPFEGSATYDVFLYTDEPVVCQIQALDVRFAVVGVATQEVDPANGPHQRLTTSVTTTEQANTVAVDYCDIARTP
jgi:hypothetical protein